MESTAPLVLVTGASGYVANHLVQQLLQSGKYRVRGTVRSLKNEAKIAPLRSLVADPKYPLELVEADLLSPDTWPAAVKDVDYVLHTASPFVNRVKNEDELIKPAVEGTLSVLRACASPDSKVKRVVVTSSIVAISAGREPNLPRGHVHTEKDWTNPANCKSQPYHKSKTLAEKAAWDFVKAIPENGNKFELVTINPGLLIGPILSSTDGTATSIVADILKAANPAQPCMCIVLADVRDAALAHIRAIEVPEAAGKRFLIGEKVFWWKDMADVLNKEFVPMGYKCKTAVAPKWFLRVHSIFDAQTVTILPDLGYQYRIDNSQSKEVLGITYRPVETALIQTAHDLIQKGGVPKTKNYKPQTN